MMKVLLNNQRKMMLNTLKTQPAKNYVSYLIAVIAVGFLLVVFSGTVWSVGPSITESVLAGIVSYGFLLVVGFIILLGLPQIFKLLYSSTDLNLLFTLPISTRHIYWMKYIQSFFGIPLFILILFMIPLFTYGLASGASLIFYPVIIILLFAVCLIGLSIAYLLNLVLIQLIPKNRANEFMTVMSVLSGLVAYLLFVLPSMMNDQPLSETLLDGFPIFPKWIPVTWGSDAFIHAANGSLKFFLPLLLLLLLAAVSIGVTSMLVERGFRTGWIHLSEGGRKKKHKVKEKRKYSVRHPVIAIGIKEWLSVKRDMREWLVFMPIIFFTIFPLVGFFSGGASLNDIRGLHEVSWPIAQGGFLFLFAVLNGTLAASSIGREGSSVWILSTLPLSGKQIIRGKFWISWLMPLLLLTIVEVILGILLDWKIWQFVAGFLLKSVLTLGMSAIGLWLGTIGAKYNPVNPQARLNFGVTITLLIISYVYLFIAILPFILLLIPSEAAAFIGEMSQDAPGMIGSIFSLFHLFLTLKASYPLFIISLFSFIILLVSVGTAILFLHLGAQRINKGIKIDMVDDSRSKPLFNRKKFGRNL